jgi:DMSO reductase family type II enzyme chaperone
VSKQLSIDVEPQQMGAAARSQIYKRFSLAFSYPELETQWQAVTGSASEVLGYAIKDLPYPLPLTGRESSSQHYTLGDLQLSYMRLFEVARGSSAISLNESEFTGNPQKEVWEDVIRFYEHFGLNYDSTVATQWPDHLVVELECLHYLSFLQAGLAGDQGPILRAQRDFLERHLINWLPRLVERLACVEGNEPYASQSESLLEYLNAERAYLRDAVEEA